MLAPWWGDNIISVLLSYSSLLLPSPSSSVLIIETRHYLREMYIMSTLCPELWILFWKKLRNFCKVLQFSLVTQSCLTLCNPMNHSMPGLPVHHKLLEFTQTHVHRVSDAIQPSHPLSSPSPPAPNPSQHQGLFQWVNFLHEVAKYWSFSFSISPSNEHPGLISFRMGWLDLLAVQGTLKSLLQHHSSKAFFGISYWQYISIFASKIFKTFL